MPRSVLDKYRLIQDIDIRAKAEQRQADLAEMQRTNLPTQLRREEAETSRLETQNQLDRQRLLSQVQENDLRSVLTLGARLDGIEDMGRRREIIASHIEQGLRQGRNMRDSIELFRSPIERQNQILAGAKNIGVQLGVIKPEPQPRTVRPSLPKTYTYGPTGERVSLMIDPSGQIVRSPYLEERKAGSEYQPLMIDQETGQLVARQEGLPLGKSGRNMVVKEGYSLKKQNAMFNIIEDIIGRDPKTGKIERDQIEKYFGGPKRVKKSILNLADDWLQSGAISKEDYDWLSKANSLTTVIGGLFNIYRKEITGAAAAVLELDRLEKTYIHPRMSPNQFKAAFDVLSDVRSEHQRIISGMLRDGYTLDDLQSQDHWKRFLTVQEDGKTVINPRIDFYKNDYKGRFRELAAQGLDPVTIKNTLIKEGYPVPSFSR